MRMLSHLQEFVGAVQVGGLARQEDVKAAGRIAGEDLLGMNLEDGDGNPVSSVPTRRAIGRHRQSASFYRDFRNHDELALT